MIADHLLRYYEAHDRDLTYTVVRSMVIEGHEVAWMRYDGTVKVDITGEGREGQPFTGHELMCECDFREGVGWERKDGRIYSLDGERKCLPRKVAKHMRCLELRQEYIERFKDSDSWHDDSWALRKHFEEIVLDLIERAKADEFIGEDSGGAAFWGGYFYLQTVAEIIDQFVGHLWERIHQMVADKKIGLDGAVIKPYSEPPPPRWEEYARLEVDGWVGIASLPGHRQMAREWKLEVLDPDGKPAYSFLPGLALDYDPLFGPDVSDVEHARRKLDELIGQVRGADVEARGTLDDD